MSGVSYSLKTEFACELVHMFLCSMRFVAFISVSHKSNKMQESPSNRQDYLTCRSSLGYISPVNVLAMSHYISISPRGRLSQTVSAYRCTYRCVYMWQLFNLYSCSKVRKTTLHRDMFAHVYILNRRGFTRSCV